MRPIAVLIAAALFAGCGLELLTATAIQSELQAEQVKSLRGQVQGAATQQGHVQLQRAVDAFHAEKGRYPGRLEELVPGHLPAVPTLPDGSPYAYDPATGRVARGQAEAGQQLLQQVQSAIVRYGTDTGYYPPALDALAPKYLPAPPRTASGQPLLYDNQTGYVALPHDPGGHAAGQSVGPGVGGAAGAALGIQQELGNMNTSGANQAGTAARGSASDISERHNQRQQNVLDDLGF